MKYLKLFESYKSQKELEELTNLIIKKLAKETWNWHEDFVWSEPKDWMNDPDSIINKSFRVNFLNEKGDGFTDSANYVVDYFDGSEIMFKGYNQKFSIDDVELTWSKTNKAKFKKFIPTTMNSAVLDEEDKFDELKSFIQNATVRISLEATDDKHIKGNLTPVEPTFMYITLFYNKSLLKDLQEDKKYKLKRDDKYEFFDLYSTLYKELHKTLLHELQHAYDNYRSNGKSFKRQNKEYIEKKKKADFIKNKTKELKEDELELVNKMNQEYLNLPHEIDARFTQAIKELTFAEIEFPDDLSGYYFEMKPFDEIYKKFKFLIKGWEFMSDKDKRRLTRRLSQFWHLEKERIEKENKKTIKSEVSTNESAHTIAYHITSKNNLDSILKNGLEPRVPEDYGIKGDTKGVYLFKTIDDTKNALWNWLGERIEEWEEETGKEYEEVLLHVDITGLECIDSVGFEWTCLEHIPADRIISIDYEV